jgi:photosystem II stability/assembly factor-like uncharacterized protein
MFVDMNRGYIYANAGPTALLATDDGGTTWRVLLDTGGPEFSAPQLYFLDAERFWVRVSHILPGPQEEELLYHTSDGGRTLEIYPLTFAEPHGRGGVEACATLFFRTASEGWACCAESLQKTTDAGRTWRVVRALGEDALDRPWMFDDREGIAMLRHSNAIARTEDGGLTWRQVYDRGLTDVQCKGDFCAGRVWLHGPVLSSRDRGRTWEDMRVPLQGGGRDELWHVQPIHPNLVVAVGQDVGFTASELDRIATGEKGIKRPPQGFILKWDGAIWTRIVHTDPDNFSGAYFLDENRGWLFADGRVKEEPARVFKTLDGGQTLEFVPDYFRQLAALTPTQPPIVFETPTPSTP